MAGYNANFVGGSVLPNASQAQPGIWSIQEVHRGRVGGKWPTLAVSAAATGGDLVYQIEQGGTSYVVHQFTTIGTATFTLTATKDIEYLVVGGGGGGGSILDETVGGGGGAGGFLTGTLSNLSAGSYAVKVGNGGAPIASGQSSEFHTIIAEGGGAGGNGLNNTPAASGGSGGGGSGTAAADVIGATGTSGQGYSGGTGRGGSVGYYTMAKGAGGGGGAGGAGLNGNIYTTYGTYVPFSLGAQGGPGLPSSITGTTRYYAGGGGGGYTIQYATYATSVENPGDFLQSGGLGGIGGGGHAILGSYVFNGNATLPSERRAAGNGQLNTGGGGGAGGGSGGSGIVIVRYALS